MVPVGDDKEELNPMSHITLPLLTLGLSLASVLCWAAEPNTDEVKAIAEIKKLGGRVRFYQESPGKLVIGVDLAFTQVTDAGLDRLKGLTTLRYCICWRTLRWPTLGWNISRG